MKQIAYQNLLLIICGAMIFPLTLNAQTASHDGVQVRVLEINPNTYFYGEPFRIYFIVENTANTPKRYHAPWGATTVQYELKNTKTGNVFEKRGNFIVEGFNKNIVPTPLKPKAKGYLHVHIGRDFGTVVLTNKKVTGHSLVQYNVAAIPVGEYELTLRYNLFPSDKVISAKHTFKVVEPPQNLKDVRDKYIKTVYYANSTGYDGSRTYSASHPDSYENFLKKYPGNIFAEYARIDMTLVIYSNPGPTSEEKVKKRKEYLDFYPLIKHEHVKLYYAEKLPYVLQQIVLKQEGIGTPQDVLLSKLKQLSDNMLRNKMNDSYHASERFIVGMPSLTGLRNYAVKEK